VERGGGVGGAMAGALPRCRAMAVERAARPRHRAVVAGGVGGAT
jgi:hypothetical protein